MRLDWILDVSVPSELISLMQVAADQTAIAEGLSKPVCTTVRFCDDAAIRELNAAHRGLDQSTDVLSFPSVSWPVGVTAGHVPEKLNRVLDPELHACCLGDVVISLDHLKAQAEEYAKKLEAVQVTVRAKAGNGGKLFGAVTSEAISKALREQFDMDIEKNKIVQAEPIKSFGSYTVKAKLGYEISGNINVLVVEEK